MSKAVFIDKDGTLIPDIPFNVDPEKISLQDNCREGLLKLQSLGFKLIIVSNQSGIAKGLFTEELFGRVIVRMRELLAQEGITLTDFYYCPHDPEGIVSAYAQSCECRKPKAGLLIKAAKRHQIDLSQSWMIGDILNDVEAGNRAGCKSILINNGNETEWDNDGLRKPVFIAATINEAAGHIIQHITSTNTYERNLPSIH